MKDEKKYFKKLLRFESEIRLNVALNAKKKRIPADDLIYAMVISTLAMCMARTNMNESDALYLLSTTVNHAMNAVKLQLDAE